MSTITPGTYRARAIEAKLTTTSTGNAQVGILFSLLQPGYEGQTISYYGSLSEKALPITVRALRACGWTGNELADLSGVDASEVELEVAEETYNGRTSLRVKWVNRLKTDGGITGALDAAEAKRVSARLRGAIMALDAESGAKPATKVAKPKPQRAPEPPPHTDADAPADIPF